MNPNDHNTETHPDSEDLAPIPPENDSERESGAMEPREPKVDTTDSKSLDSSEDIDGSELEAVGNEERRRKWLLLLLLFLLLILCICCGLFYSYYKRPKPIPDLIPAPVDVNYPPHYLFSIYGMDKPVGVAVSPDNQRIYAAETGGKRLVRIFDREGNPLGSFAPPRTQPGERSPVYIAVAPNGRVFVTDRSQHAVFVYQPDGGYLDTFLGPELSLSEYIVDHNGSLPPGTNFGYDVFEKQVYFQPPGQAELVLPEPDSPGWSPLGIRIDAQGEMLVTDVTKTHNCVRSLPGELTLARDWGEFAPTMGMFGTSGKGKDQFLYPNSAMADSQGRVFVSDGNNGRISVWDAQGNFLLDFGMGTGEGSLSLPRGLFIDEHDRMYVVDAVGQNVTVYDVSGSEPVFLYTFGDFGMNDGLFNYPNDIAVDLTGRLYIADRENNRIQVWSY